MTALHVSAQQDRSHVFLVLVSPILVVAIGHFAARLFYSLFGDWAWLGSSLTYWGSMILVIWLLGDKQSIKNWFAKSQGSKWWILLALAMGAISFPLLFFPNLQVMKPFGLVVLWFLFAVINSTCEEAYWRGFLLDVTSHLPRAFGVIYSTIFFTAIHPLMLGVFSKINRFDPANPTALIPFWIILVILSLSFSLLYLKTKSLRLPVLSHFLSDLGNLSIFLFMNMVTM
jgi:membrane protease YdiL (CAAX protease family)